ncbi:putative tetratricopeptide-like helical domain superfamily [Helianthus debilis subsp. tardiflorus]
MAEAVLKEMVESGFQPNIYVLISLIQCYGKADRTDDVVTTFDRIIALGITPDERTCGCLLNVMTQTPREELGKLTRCVQIANPKLGSLIEAFVNSVFIKHVQLYDTLTVGECYPAAKHECFYLYILIALRFELCSRPVLTTPLQRAGCPLVNQ